jgi:hypothetical protein
MNFCSSKMSSLKYIKLYFKNVLIGNVFVFNLTASFKNMLLSYFQILSGCYLRLLHTVLAFVRF